MQKHIAPFESFLATVEKTEHRPARSKRLTLAYLKRVNGVPEFLKAAASYAEQQLALNTLESMPRFWRTVNAMNIVIQTSHKASERFAHDSLVLSWLEPLNERRPTPQKESNIYSMASWLQTISLATYMNIESAANAILIRDSNNPLLDRAVAVWNKALENLAYQNYDAAQDIREVRAS